MTQRSKTGSWESRTVTACLAVMMAVSLASGKGLAQDRIPGDTDRELRLTVLVYIYTGVPQSDLAWAERVASKHFQKARVEINWINCPHTPSNNPNPACRVPPAPTNLYLNMLSNLDLGPHVSKSAMGFALIALPPTRSDRVIVSYARVKRQLRETPRLTLGKLLGKVFAHEIGHLLLENSSHAPDGLMSALWGPNELKYPGFMTLLFSQEQLIRIRANVLARMKDQESQEAMIVASRSTDRPGRSYRSGALCPSTTSRSAAPPSANGLGRRCASAHTLPALPTAGILSRSNNVRGIFQF